VCIRYLVLQSNVKKFPFGKLMRHRSRRPIVHSDIVHIKIAIDSEPVGFLVVRKVYANSKPIVCAAIVNRNISQVEHAVVHEGGPPPNAPRLNMAHLCTQTFRMEARVCRLSQIIKKRRPGRALAFIKTQMTTGPTSTHEPSQSGKKQRIYIYSLWDYNEVRSI
jgi:hypothetical protein